MKKFLVFIILASAIQFANSQCTAFLGPDKQFMPCSNPYTLNADTLFHEPASTTFQLQQLAAFDTIFGVGGSIDTLIPLTSKTMFTATRADGCSDVCIVGVAIRTWPIPNLGLDTSLYLGFQEETIDILSKFNTAVIFTSGYNHHTWSTPTPQNVDTGKYYVVVVTHDGCSDSLNITIKCAIKKDTIVKKCVDGKFNLTELYVKSGYTNLWKTIRFIQNDTINTATPNAVDTGRYMLLSSKPGRCTDTMMVKVENRPKLDLGPDRKVIKCFGSTADITKEFILTGLTTLWTTPDETKAPTGTHRLIATNSFGCKDTAFVEVRDTTKPEIGPNENERICPAGDTLNLTSSFLLNDLRTQWNTPNPTKASDAGTYRVIASDNFGCRDTGYFVIEHFEQPPFLNDTTVKICSGKIKNLNTVYNLGTEFVLVDWNTPNPTAVIDGVYTITIQNSFTGCLFNAAVTVETIPNTPPALNLCIFNTGNTSIFTTNNFKTATIDKRGHVWAGTELGGLYRFTPLIGTACGGTWQKLTPNSGISTINNSYRDLYPSNITGDTSIWAASMGHTPLQDITGGVDRITSLSGAVEHYGSVEDNNSGTFKSRHTQSIIQSKTGKIYVAQGASLQPDTTQFGGGIFRILDGGAYVRNTVNPSALFTQLPVNINIEDNKYTAVGKRGNEIWFGVQKSVGMNTGPFFPRIQKWKDSTNSFGGIIDDGNSPIPFNNINLIVTAIFTAGDGRTYVGLNDSLGIGVLDSGDENSTLPWTLVNTSNSPLPYNARINFNAITEVNGEIWFGTNYGLMVYDGTGPLTECASYKFYTTAQGLPSNNVTDIAFDSTNYNLWITTNNGIAKIVVNHEIFGTVYNVSAGNYEALRTNLKKIPLKNAKVRLYEKRTNLPDILVTTKITDSTGTFNFSSVPPLKNYYVDVDYKDSFYLYRYKNIKSNSIIGDVLIPDSLGVEIDSLMVAAFQKPISFNLYFTNVTPIIAQGFDISDYLKPYNFYNNNIIDTNHIKRVENIADYYLSVATIYAMAQNRIDLKAEQYASFLDAAHSMLAFTKFGTEFNRSNLLGQDDPRKALMTNLIKTFILEAKFLFNKAFEAIADEATKKQFGESLTNLNTIVDLSVNTINNGFLGTAINEIIESSKKLILTIPTGISYETFCKEEHELLIPGLANQATNLASSRKYGLVYPRIYSTADPVPPALPSYNKQQIDIHDAAKEDISLDKDVAKLADAAAGSFDAVAEFTKGNIQLAMKVFSTVSKVINTSLLIRAGYRGLVASDSIGILSHFVTREAGFQQGQAAILNASPTKQLATQVVLDSLRARRARYKITLDELKPFYNAPFDSVNYYSKLKKYISADSLLRVELDNVNNTVRPQIKDGIENINFYKPRLDMAVDSFASSYFIANASFGTENLAYTFTKDSVSLKLSLSNGVDKLKIKIDSTVNAYEQLLTMGSSIITPAYLLQTGFTMNFSNKPDSAGTITYTLKNIGSFTQTNVGALIGQPTGGFNITSHSFVNLGNFSPGQSKLLTYNFIAPHIDTVGTYTIQFFADNGVHNNINGLLVTIAPTEVTSVANGLWSNPETWSTLQVPDAGSIVTIKHNVDVDIVTAECESIKAIAPGMLKVKAGMKLTVRK